MYAYFREIALNRPIDVTLYNIPMFASPIDVPTIRRLAEFERIVGIKDSSGDMAFMMRMMAAVRPVRPDFSFLTGWEAVLVPMLLIGCDGGTNATSGVVPELTRKVYDLTRAGRVDEAMRLQFRLLELFDCMIGSADFPEGVRAAVELRGFRMGRVRMPQTDKQEVDFAALQKVLRCILAESGYVDAPAEGCPPRRAARPRPHQPHRGRRGASAAPAGRGVRGKNSGGRSQNAEAVGWVQRSEPHHRIMVGLAAARPTLLLFLGRTICGSSSAANVCQRRWTSAAAGTPTCTHKA